MQPAGPRGTVDDGTRRLIGLGRMNGNDKRTNGARLPKCGLAGRRR